MQPHCNRKLLIRRGHILPPPLARRAIANAFVHGHRRNAVTLAETAAEAAQLSLSPVNSMAEILDDLKNKDDRFKKPPKDIQGNHPPEPVSILLKTIFAHRFATTNPGKIPPPAPAADQASPALCHPTMSRVSPW